MTCVCGDSGKTGNDRRWGIYDDNDGMYFELSGTTLSTGVRTSTSGSPVDTIVAQSSWNGDKLDGTGLSGVTIDITKVQLWWIDYQWLGSGHARFGIYGEDGARIVAHTVNNSNVITLPFTQTGTLPLRFQNTNTGGTSGSSELTTMCSTVIIEGEISPFFSNQSGGEVFGKVFNTDAVDTVIINAAGTGYSVNDILTVSGGTGSSASFSIDTVGGSGEVLTITKLDEGNYTVNPSSSGAATTVAPAGGTGCTLDLTFTGVGGSVKPLTIMRTNILNDLGNTNRNHLIPLDYTFFIADGPAHVSVIEDTTLFTPTWSSNVGGAQHDSNAVSRANGKTVWGGIYDNGTYSIDLRPVYDITSGTLRLQSNGSSIQNVGLYVRGIIGSTPNVSAAINWEEF